jgi:hypothetical protein
MGFGQFALGITYTDTLEAVSGWNHGLKALSRTQHGHKLLAIFGLFHIMQSTI